MNGIPLVVFIFCIWPIIVHFLILYGVRFITSRDWKNIQWHNLKFPWSKEL